MFTSKHGNQLIDFEVPRGWVRFWQGGRGGRGDVCVCGYRQGLFSSLNGALSSGMRDACANE